MNGKIIKLHLNFKNTDFYYFKVKGLVAPEYIVSYKYLKGRLLADNIIEKLGYISMGGEEEDIEIEKKKTELKQKMKCIIF